MSEATIRRQTNFIFYETTNKQTNSLVLLPKATLLKKTHRDTSVFKLNLLKNQFQILKFFLFFTCISTLSLSAQSPYISSSSGTNNICTGATITLTGNFIYNYKQWQVKVSGTWTNISGATGTSYNVTASGEYRLRTSTVVSFSPQTITNEIAINNATALNIVDNLPIAGQLTTSNAFNVSINTTNPPDYTSYTWYLNGAPIASPFNTYVQIRKPGDYMLITTGPCGIERSNVDAIYFETSDPSWDATTFAAPYICSTSCSITGPTIVNGDITVQNGATFSIVGSKVNFNGCYGIRVESGGKLLIGDRSTLSSSTMWNGIVIEDGGEALIHQQTYISDAVAAVILQGEAEAKIKYSTFGRNVLHIGIDEYTGFDTAYIAFDTFGHVIDSATALGCTSYTDYNNLNVVRGTYISATGVISFLDSHPILIHENHVWMTEERSNRWNSGFLICTDVDSLEVVTNEINGFFNYAIKITGGRNVKCMLNNIKNLTQSRTSYGYTPPPTDPSFGKALYFKDVKHIRITDNDIRHWVYGAQYYEYNLNNNFALFAENKLRNCKYGLVVANIQDPINYSGSNNTNVYGDQIDLQIKCNLFTGNEVGIVGTGLLITQGSTTLSAGNRFWNLSLGGYLNSINSIIWHYSSNFNYYFKFNGPTYHDKPDQINNGNITLDGNSKNGSTSNFTPLTSINVMENPCTVLQNGPALSNNNNSKLNYITLFPNPSTSKITLEGFESGSQFILYNLKGQILNSFYCNDISITIDIDALNEGIYLMYILSPSSTSMHKFIKL